MYESANDSGTIQRMTPGEASAQGHTLLVNIPDVGDRFTPHVFDYDGGIGFIDDGWTTNDTGHVEHIVQGQPGYVDGYGWLIETPDGDIIITYADATGQEGDRDQALQILQHTYPQEFPSS